MPGPTLLVRVRDTTGLLPLLCGLEQQTRLEEMIDAREQLGYAAELEHEVTITEPGLKVRSTVKARPREGLVIKLLNKIGLPDFHLHLPPGSSG